MSAPSTKHRRMSFFFDRRSSFPMRLKKQAARITDAIALQINVVANGRTLSGIQAKMMTSVDQHIVTQIRQRFACSLFIVYPLSYPSSDGFFAYIWI